MADQGLLELIVRMAGRPRGRVSEMWLRGRILHAPCRSARWVYGIDLSRRMVREADTLARTRGHHNTAFCQADAEALPFAMTCVI